ncbi:MAG: indole-3-glycerol phosphate synthase TrpC [Actinobacteria bacterium]|nr:indole-3-glycerol phosphate synthase TrpC [Actinomycetota bacterium]
MSVRLEDLCRASREEVERRKRLVPLAELERRAADQGEPRRFGEALSRPGTSLVAEYKRRSPSAGVIRAGAEVAEIARAYARGGAAALSILTEEEHFGGSLDDLRAGRGACELPVLRKDFTLDPYQVYEARAAGADAILLVVGAVERGELGSLHAIARALELDVLVEAHDEAELEAALEIDASVIGINNRNLADFSVDVGRTFDLLDRVPAGKVVVSESGIRGRAQIEELESAGVDAVLVGEWLMRSADPEAAVRELVRSE